ncbi:MAG TPA: thioredoxin family protein [Balneolales bacterium]|nr:thioredoxin family protein [Balneolales bacterium]
MTFVYIIVGIVVLFFALQYGMVLKMRFKKGKKAPELGGKYGKIVGSGKKAMFYFYSQSCAACKPMTPVVDKYAKKAKNIYKIDITRDMATARKFGVMGTPSTVVVENGIIKEFLVGPQKEAKLSQLLN